MTDLAKAELDSRANGFSMRLLTLALMVVVVAAAMVSGLSVAEGDKKMVVLPLAAVVGLALAVFAGTRFSGFVLLLLGVRSSIDALAFDSSSGASTGTAAVERGLNPSSLSAVLFLLASMLWLAMRYYSGTHLKASRLSMWLTAFWLAGVVSLVGSRHIQAGAMESLRIMAVVMMFIVLEQLITDRQAMARVLLASFASLLIPLGYTLYGFAIGDPATEDKSGLTRILGTFSQSNSYARYLMFMIVFGVAIYPHLKGHSKMAMRILLFISGIFLIQTLTLTAIIASVIGLIVVGVVTRRKALLVGFVVVSAIAVFASPGLASRIDTIQTQEVDGSASGNTLAWRFGYWAEVLPLANANPVTGIGIGSTAYETDAAKQPHNDFLRAYVETGIVGLLAYIGMLAALVGTCRMALRRTVRGSFDHAIAAGALGCSVCVILASATSNVITNSVALWYLIAFVAAASYVSRTAVPSSGDARDRLPYAPAHSSDRP